MSLKSFVNNNAEWEAFCQELDELIEQQHRRMEQSELVIDIHRAQGSIHMLRKLKFLRDKVNGTK